MLKVTNDKGQLVVSAGTPNSMENLICRRPLMLKDLSDWQVEYKNEVGDNLSWWAVQDYLDNQYDVEEWELPLIAKYLGLDYD